MGFSGRGWALSHAHSTHSAAHSTAHAAAALPIVKRDGKRFGFVTYAPPPTCIQVRKVVRKVVREVVRKVARGRGGRGAKLHLPPKFAAEDLADGWREVRGV